MPRVILKQSKKDSTSELKNNMLQAGVLFGHHVSKLHPKMKPYIYGMRNMIHIIDPDKCLEGLNKAIEFLEKIKKEGKKVLVVGTRVHIRDLTEDLANACGFYYISQRWLGGTLTNFPVIVKRIEYWQDLEKKKVEGYFDKYTKKEKMEIDEEIEKLKSQFLGIKDMRKLPDAIIILDLQRNYTAAEEAHRKGIPIVGIVDTNIDPTIIDYPIPANDDAYSSVKFIVEKLKEGILNMTQK